MVKFIGEYEAKLDDKGRVVVPAAFKNIVGKHSGDGEVSFVIKKDLFANCLNMFTYEQWDQESEQVRSRLNLFRKEDAAWYREYMMDRALVTLDQKVGRIIIPKNLLAKIGVGKDIVFSGNDFKIEIWAKENFGVGRMSEEDFTSLTEKLLG
ncbi:MAG: protein mraZ [Bacteroidales bacterium]|nr:protein mraZ [Bacteroidales bacterium]